MVWITQVKVQNFENPELYVVVVFVFKGPPTAKGHMETGPWLKVSSDRLVKPGIEPVTSGLQGKWFIHYTTWVPKS